jgi:hypothetical protein
MRLTPGQSKVTFGHPSRQIDPCTDRESYQAGGNLTLITGNAVSQIHGTPITDETGLGRWSGTTFQGKLGTKLTMITGYRTCNGSVKTSPLGSTYTREYTYFKNKGEKTPNPRKHFIQDITSLILHHKEMGDAILLMLDANGTLETDTALQNLLIQCELQDIHRNDPSPTTYIGASNRRIDFIFGCERVDNHAVRSGTLSYHEGPQADHRGLYVDLMLPAIFDHTVTPLASHSKRLLHNGNPETVETYLTSVHKYYRDHNMVHRISQLYKNHSSMSRSEVRNALIKWDLDQGRAMLSSELSLRLAPKPHQWSPTLRNAGIIFRYWKLRLKEIQHSHNYSDTFVRWQARLRLSDPDFDIPHLNDTLTIEQIRTSLNLAKKHLRRIQRNSTDHRNQSYQDLITTYNEDHNPSTQARSRQKATIVANTVRNETCRRIYNKISGVIKPATHSAGLSKLNIPRQKDCTSATQPNEVHQILKTHAPDDLIWDTIINKEDIEQHLLTYNREAFRAASESPCGHGIIYDAITFSSLSPEADELLKGSIPPGWHHSDPLIQEFLASFTIPDNATDREDIPTEITTEQITKGFQSWKEMTTTSPSGRHLGHYKAIIQDTVLLQCLHDFLNIAITRGIAIPRWSQATNILIEKDPGTPNINRLRIIHLFEADFNFFLKLQWGHRLVRHAEKFDLLNDGQHGSRPGRTAMDPIMLIQLTTDLSRLLKVNLARFDNDASACYDRIIVALGMLAARRLGMPGNAIKTHADALRFMQYSVKTIHGISEDSYEGTPFEPLFGTGQGSGASPAVWLTLVVLLLNTLDRIIPERTKFTSPDGSIISSRLVDAFVDDTSLGFTNIDSTYEEMIHRLQEISQTWEHLLHLSGGSLNLKKCNWYILFWDWKNGRPILRQSQPNDPKITLWQGTNTHTITEVKRMELSSAPRILGVHLSPLGDFSHQIQVCKNKANGFAAKLLSPTITASDTRIFHRSIYTPSMRYQLAALAVDEEDLNTIQSKIIPVILQKLHINRNLPTAIRHGPISLGGVDLYDLRTEAGLEAIKYMRNAIYSQSEAGKLILTNIHYSQLEAGITQPILEHPEIHLAYLTPTWITSIRQYLHCHNLTITLTATHDILLREKNDQIIMTAEHLHRYSPQQQKDINLVRLYLQVHTLADLTDSHRPTAILLHMLDGKRNPDTPISPLWPRQSEPSNTQRRLWKRFISSSYLRYVPYWKQKPTTNPTPQHKPPTDEQTPTTTLSLPVCIRQLPRSQRRLLDSLTQVATDKSIWEAFRSRKRINIASDGGLSSNKVGTFGWTIATNKETLYTCSGPVDGPRDTSSSTRSELCGYASALLLLTNLAKTWKTRHRCKFRWIVDSKAAIQRVLRHTRGNKRNRKQPDDLDFMTIIIECTRELKRNIKISWTKGHQDEQCPYEKLSLRARLNVDADRLATLHRLRGKLKSTEHTDHTKEQNISISINGVRIQSQVDSCIRFHVNGYHLRHFMQSKNKWSNAVWKEIDFEMFGSHFRSLLPHQQISHMKHVHDQQPLGKRRNRQAPIPDPILEKCPCCNHPTEDKQHLLTCTKNPEAKAAMDTLRKTILEKHDIHPIRFLLIEGIKQWIEHPDRPFRPNVEHFPPHLHDSIHQAISSQERIGWKHLLNGFLSTAWRSLAHQDMLSATKSDQPKGLQRLRTCISAIHIFTRTLWLARNSVLHEETQINNLNTARTAEQVEVSYYHQRPQLLRFDDRHLCDRSLNKLLSGSSSTRRRWLRLIKSSVQLHAIDGKRQTTIQSFFPTVR